MLSIHISPFFPHHTLVSYRDRDCNHHILTIGPTSDQFRPISLRSYGRRGQDASTARRRQSYDSVCTSSNPLNAKTEADMNEEEEIKTGSRYSGTGLAYNNRTDGFISFILFFFATQRCRYPLLLRISWPDPCENSLREGLLRLSALRPEIKVDSH